MKDWRNIRLELARAPEFPNGSVSRAYLLRLPLDDSDFVDEAMLLQNPRLGTVRRYWSNSPDQTGLVQKLDGVLIINCEGESARILRLDGRSICLGQEFSLIESDGDAQVFRVTSIR